MNQCVPSCDIDENHTPSSFPLRSSSNSGAIDVPMLDYEVAELTWENGQLWIHGLGLPRVAAKAISSATWEKPRASGTLESIVNQATRSPRRTKPVFDGDDLVPWFDPQRAAPSNTTTMDAMVPCSNHTDEQQSAKIMDSVPRGGVLGTCMVGCPSRVESCNGPHTHTHQEEDEALLAGKRARVAREWSSKDHSVSGSATFGRDSQHVTFDTCDRELGVAFTSTTSMGSPENTSSAKQGTKTTTTTDDHDSVCHSRPQRETGEEEDRKKGIRKSSVSTKSRAAAIHNQSERKRRDKINQRMKTLQKLVPNSSKTDKASMLDEVIEYLKQLQAQVQMISRMNMSSMMLPMAMQQQLPMSMMPPMGMGMGLGMGMGMGMDLNVVGRANMAGIPPILHPFAFTHMISWDASTINDRLQGAPAPMLMSDPLSTFLASQSQPMTIDAYSRMVAMHQQQHQPPASNSKS